MCFSDENITITIQANLNNYTANSSRTMARMTLKIVPVKVSIYDSCTDFERMCFWDSAVYAVSENRFNGNETIGALGPNFYRKLCPNLDVNYEMENGK